jgi:hypothetical protein
MNTDQGNCQEQAGDFVHELASQGASIVAIRDKLGPAAAIRPARIDLNLTKVWAPQPPA